MIEHETICGNYSNISHTHVIHYLIFFQIQFFSLTTIYFHSGCILSTWHKHRLSGKREHQLREKKVSTRLVYGQGCRTCSPLVVNVGGLSLLCMVPSLGRWSWVTGWTDHEEQSSKQCSSMDSIISDTSFPRWIPILISFNDGLKSGTLHWDKLLISQCVLESGVFVTGLETRSKTMFLSP